MHVQKSPHNQQASSNSAESRLLGHVLVAWPDGFDARIARECVARQRLVPDWRAIPEKSQTQMTGNV